MQTSSKNVGSLTAKLKIQLSSFVPAIATLAKFTAKRVIMVTKPNHTKCKLVLFARWSCSHQPTCWNKSTSCSTVKNPVCLSNSEHSRHPTFYYPAVSHAPELHAARSIFQHHLYVLETFLQCNSPCSCKTSNCQLLRRSPQVLGPGGLADCETSTDIS